jgi:hypothetical protein
MLTCLIGENPNTEKKIYTYFVRGFGWNNKNEPKMRGDLN